MRGLYAYFLVDKYVNFMRKSSSLTKVELASFGEAYDCLAKDDKPYTSIASKNLKDIRPFSLNLKTRAN